MIALATTTFTTTPVSTTTTTTTTSIKTVLFAGYPPSSNNCDAVEKGENFFNVINEYKEREGRCNVPKKARKKMEKILDFGWVHNVV
mmetsp:Transcript_30827/g.31335  ORF Transcript_30827/g.31335 Transcript_30827/m.31335 type:complete len:87 (+) Transcript_30827:88-348(+)